MKSAAYFREKADQCRQMAKGATDQGPTILHGLCALALEFEATAVAIELGSVATRAIEWHDFPVKPNGG